MSILKALFGGSDSKSSSGNQAFPYLQGALAPAVEGGLGSMNALNQELGGGFDAYKKKAGFDFAMGEGLKGITGTGAAKGLLRSGATGRGFQKFGQGLQSSFYDNFLNRLGQSAQLGLGAAGTLTGAGQTSTSSGGSQSGILNALFG